MSTLTRIHAERTLGLNAAVHNDLRDVCERYLGVPVVMRTWARVVHGIIERSLRLQVLVCKTKFTQVVLLTSAQHTGGVCMPMFKVCVCVEV